MSISVSFLDQVDIKQVWLSCTFTKSITMFQLNTPNISKS